jgi:glutaconate CoA-transferase, subunit B
MYTIDELMAVCIGHQLCDGDLVAQGIATPLVTAGILLAKLTHAPDLMFVSAIGQSICDDWAPLGITTIEQLWIKKGKFSLSFVQGVCDFLPLYGPKEFFRPGQVDPYGNFNNIFMGGSYQSPRLRLPGSGGIPDVTAVSDHNYLYVPRHGLHTFVKTLDCRSGLGNVPDRMRGSGPHYLISDLGQFDFDQATGRMRLMSIHPGVSVNRLLAKTGFELLLPDPIPETPSPLEHELKLLREVIDPLGVRSVETLAGAARRKKLRQIVAAERSGSQEIPSPRHPQR